MKLIKKSLFLFVLSITALLASCANPPNGPIPPIGDFKAFPSARDFDPPGQVYRIDNEGVTWPVVTLEVKPELGTEENYKIEKETTWNIGGVLKTIGVAEAELPAEVKAHASRTLTATLEPASGLRERIQDGSANALLSEFFKSHTFREDNQYFLIRETISLNSIKFSTTKTWVADAGVNAKIREILDANANTDWKNEYTVSLEKSFSKPLRVWYKAEKIKLVDIMGVGPSGVLIFDLEKTQESISGLPLEPQPPNP